MQFTTKVNYSLILGALLLFGCQNRDNDKDWYLTHNSNKMEESSPLAPGIISSNQIEYGGNICEQHKEIYFTINDTSWKSSFAAFSRFENNRLLPRDTVRFDGQTMQGGDAHLSPDGDKLYIASRVNNDSTRQDGNIWVATRTPKGWSKAKKLPPTINTELGEFSPSQANSGNIYFTRFTEETHGDIYVSKFADGEYQEAIRLPETVNSKFIECDSWVSPDESFILFVRRSEDGFKNSFGHFDLYISFNINGSWSDAKNLGKEYNTNFVEGSPSLSYDLKYILYTSNRASKNPDKFDGSLDIYIQKFNLEKLKSELQFD
ncbi:MAG: hypothetical protein MI810_20975 [Flavobacteriales bacterium]|nr:hypothetical protein [Flavobacteriales bacterium]